MYKSKRDGFTTKTIAGCIILVSTAFLLPYFIRIATGVNVTSLETLVIFSLLLLTNLFIFWIYWGIGYEFHHDYLVVKGGPFRSKIRYEHITKVTATYFSVGDSLAGYRVMASRDGIEINYTTGLMGHVRIPPEQKEQFLQELKSRAPHARFITK